MSLPVTGSLGAGNKVGGQATDNLNSLTKDPVEKVTNTTERVTDQVPIPGEFPSDDTPEKKYQHDQQPPITFNALWTSFTTWVSNLVPRAFDGFESLIRWLVLRYLPPPKQAKVYEAMLNKPIASTFLVCQAICCGVPLLVFLVGLVIFAIVAVILWALLSLLVLGPILIVASMMGVSLWGWGWVLYGLVKFVDQRFLGGMITKFWLGNSIGKEGEDEQTDEEGDKGDEGSSGKEKKDE